MASVETHYDQLLSDVYSWMFGGFERGTEQNAAFFRERGITPAGSGTAVDLGSGCGFQSIPLAEAGFSVTAVDIDAKLLGELERHRWNLPIRTVRDDLIAFDRHVEGPVELIVCMTDTLLHLESRDEAARLFRNARAALEEGGRLVLTFRDLTSELTELDRFIPVRSDASTVFTCFLEYEPQTVKVHDLVYRRDGERWALSKSWYRKLRLSKAWVDRQLAGAGFTSVDSTVDGGLVTVMAMR
jgi:SAM-dependent methyltransferase